MSLILFVRISDYRTDISGKQTPFEGHRPVGWSNVLRKAN
jgi:hypothetical protein